MDSVKIMKEFDERYRMVVALYKNEHNRVIELENRIEELESQLEEVCRVYAEKI